MNIEVWHLIVGAIVTVSVSIWGAKITGRASVQVAEVTVEAGAYKRAEEIYKGTIDRLDKENAQLRTDLEEEKTARKELKKQYDALESDMEVLRRELASLRSLMPNNPHNV